MEEKQNRSLGFFAASAAVLGFGAAGHFPPSAACVFVENIFTASAMVLVTFWRFLLRPSRIVALPRFSRWISRRFSHANLEFSRGPAHDCKSSAEFLSEVVESGWFLHHLAGVGL